MPALRNLLKVEFSGADDSIILAYPSDLI